MSAAITPADVDAFVIGALGDYADKAIESELAAVRTAGEGERGTTLYRAAAALGGLVAGVANSGAPALDALAVREALIEAAGACGLIETDGRGVVVGHVDRGLRHGARTPRDLSPVATAARERAPGVIRARARGRASRPAQSSPQSPRGAARWRTRADPGSTSGAGDKAHEREPSSPPPEKPDPEHERTWRAAWAEAVPLSGTPAERYLAQVRAVVDRDRLAELHEALRWHPHAPLVTRPDGSVSRAREGGLVALVRSPSGEATGLQTTPLLPGGRGRVPGRSRRTWGTIKGGAVRLMPMQLGEWTEALAIAEGVETALGLSRLTGCPCWAALGDAGVAAFVPPIIATHVIVAADRDDAGRRAAAKLAARLAPDHDVEPLPPPASGGDWADLAARLHGGARHAA